MALNNCEPVMYRLKNKWSYWYRSKQEVHKEFYSFETLENFWNNYNLIPLPSEIKIGCNYFVLKKGIRPFWQDPVNKFGGRWVITVARKPKSKSKSKLNKLWLDVLLCLIGEEYGHSTEICGAVVNIRARINEISIWTANGNNSEAILAIGYKIKDTLHLSGHNLKYQLHKDVMDQECTKGLKWIYKL